jgi:hypothetical protein
VIAVLTEFSPDGLMPLVKPIVLYVDPASARFRILVSLSKCRGYRAYSASLMSCLDGDDVSDRRLHNTCTTLFKHGLIEKVRGMYQLTPAGLDLVGG